MVVSKRQHIIKVPKLKEMSSVTYLQLQASRSNVPFRDLVGFRKTLATFTIGC